MWQLVFSDCLPRDGQNATVALSRLGNGAAGPTEAATAATVHLAQFVGSGDAGAAVMALLRRLHGDVCPIDGATSARMRTCTTLCDDASGETTEVVEPWGGAVSMAEVAALATAVTQRVKGLERLDGIAIMGSLPPGVEESLYGELLAMVAALPAFWQGHGRKTRVLVDSCTGLAGLLGSGHVGMLKVNGKEAVTAAYGSATARRMLDGGGGGDHVGDEMGIAGAATMLLARYPALEWVAVTDGPGAALLFGRGGLPAASASGRTSSPVRKGDFANPIGAGDTVAAVTLHSWSRGALAADAFRAGLAAGCASC
ncbi:unnamed protein product, partial [Phaeothamnion confervicola]